MTLSLNTKIELYTGGELDSTVSVKKVTPKYAFATTKSGKELKFKRSVCKKGHCSLTNSGMYWAIIEGTKSNFDFLA